MEYLKINGEFPRLAPCGVTLGKFDRDPQRPYASGGKGTGIQEYDRL